MTAEPSAERPDCELVDDGLLKVSEVAEFLRISRGSVYKLMDQGKLRSVKLGRSRRIPRRSVVELAAKSLSGDTRASPCGG